MPDHPGKGLYFNDEAALDASFGIAEAGDRVAKIVLDVDTPFTLGITGKWGAGKTSVLRRAFASLKGGQMQVEVPFSKPQKEGDEAGWNRLSFDWQGRQAELLFDAAHMARADRSLAVWFSPWQHQVATNPVLPLLLEIKKQFSWKVKALGVTTKNLRRGALAGVTLLERLIDGALVLQGGDGIATGTTEAVRKAWQDSGDRLESLDDGQRFQLLFQDAIETALDGLGEEGESDQGRLIVFVDDLDRCEESVVVQLLEAIKLYLGSPRCVFVLGIDEGAVLQALERHWSGRSEDFNRDYLQKLFQMTISVPAPRPARMTASVARQLGGHGWFDPPGFADQLVELLEPNPRRVKNFVNGLCAQWVLLEGAASIHALPEEGTRKYQLRFILLHYLRSYHSAVWRLLERQPWTLRILHKVLFRNADAAVELPELCNAAEQRLVERLMFRAFAHVLAGSADDKDKDRFHDFIPLADAVELASERIDRKRSDEVFVRYFKSGVFQPGDDLPGELLYLPCREETEP